MVLLQHKLSVKLSQRQILTPGLVQMVSVLALNKLELKDMINTEMVENPVLEELEDSVPLLDEVGKKEEDRERAAAATTEENPITAVEKKDPFEEIDFGSFFQDYLDPGYRTHSEMEDIERPSFENFLSKPTNLTDHLSWQLGALSLRREVREAADLIVGNLNEDGYLIASDEELLGIAPPAPPEADAEAAKNIANEVQALGIADATASGDGAGLSEAVGTSDLSDDLEIAGLSTGEVSTATDPASISSGNTAAAVAPAPEPAPRVTYQPHFSAADLQEALQVVQQLDPPGVACRDLRQCLLNQLRFHQVQLEQRKNGNGTEQVLQDAMAVVDQHLRGLQNKQHKEIAKAIGRPIEAVQAAFDYIRTLDPRPGLQYNKVQARLIEPDVAFVKHGDEWLVIMNDEDLPQYTARSLRHRWLAHGDRRDRVPVADGRHARRAARSVEVPPRVHDARTDGHGRLSARSAGPRGRRAWRWRRRDARDDGEGHQARSRAPAPSGARSRDEPARTLMAPTMQRVLPWK